MDPATTAMVVKIVLGLAAIAAVVAVLRWVWNSRKAEGGTAEKANALETAVVDTAAREERVRKQETQIHEDWKKAGAARRKRSRPK